MNRALTLIVLAIPLLTLGIWVANMLYARSQSPLYQVSITGFDPRDLLHGRYIVFLYDWDTITPPLSPTPDIQTGRYYIPETNADALDALFRQSNHNFSVRLQFYNGQPQIRELLINDLPWKTWLSNQPAINGAPD